jgi:hypothetical protein
MKKLIIVLFAVMLGMAAQAQVFTMYNALGSSVASDTTTDTGTSTLTSRYVSPAPATTTTIWVAVTKISGTVGGTITLQGSLDGSTWKAAYALNTATALAAFTATDASNTYHWIITGSPFLYYRISWTGTGTMAASFTGKVFRSK